jgi:transposase
MQIAEEHERDEAIFHAYASGGYSLKEIGDHFGLHYSRVSRILKQQRLAKIKA